MRMRMKKFLTGLFAAALLMTGCGGEQGTTDENSQARIVKVGMIKHLNASEKQMEEYLFKVQEKTRAKVVNHVPVFFDSLNAMQLAAESGNVDQISTYKSVADYLIANNAKFEIAAADSIKGLGDSFCFAVRKDDANLKADLDKAVTEMKADGTLAKLVKEYISDVDKSNPPKVEIPMIDGADTLKVGVTGDLPPLDLILPDNSPAGFNTAMLAEVAKRLGKNIAVVQIESGARAAALSSGQIDVIFWVTVPLDDTLIPADVDKPEGVELSAPYFEDSVEHLHLKK